MRCPVDSQAAPATCQMAQSSSNVTDLLLAWSGGKRAALDQLIPLVHGELLALARRHMARERAHHTLQATALVNEAFLRMVDMRRVEWRDRAHFFAVAARVMRHVLVDLARSKQFQKRGGRAVHVSLDDAGPLAAASGYDVVGLNDALDSLAEVDPRRGKVVELRIFGGLTIEETAATLNVSTDTVTRDWRLAKAWLGRELARATQDTRA
ncbi:MAG TPA: sigma-70 family RNA polymerase sigma factor [Vicinamibacterales bacterium]|nr:sigma-70 family RNA polymerase sigma factor [Vicinamibacterales bacterium]